MNKDTVEAIKAKMNEAIAGGNVEGFVDELVDNINDSVAKEAAIQTAKLAKEMSGVSDEKVLAGRGILPLTAEEKEFYGQLVKAKGELSNFEVALPVTIESKVYDKMIQTHELLSKIGFVDSKGITEWILAKNLDFAGTWGDLNEPITAEANAAFVKVEFGQKKLSCWIPVPETMLDLGMVWLDQFVTTYLAEIIARKLEAAVVTGDGSKKPVGMIKVVNVEEQTVPAVDKETITVTDLSPRSLGQIAKNFTADGTRTVKAIDMVVNPYDYWDKVYGAIFYTDTDGSVKKTNLPLNVIQSCAVPSGKAVFGILDRYFATVGFGKSGKIQYSDHYKFLEDLRVYKARCVAYGTPEDNDSFIYADISGLEEAAVPTRAQKKASTNG